MVLSLAACGKEPAEAPEPEEEAEEEEEETPEDIEEVEVDYGPNSELARENVYDCSVVDLDIDFNTAYFCAAGNTDKGAYYISRLYDDYTNYALVLTELDDNGKVVNEAPLTLPYYLPNDSLDENSDLYRANSDPKGIHFDDHNKFLKQFDLKFEAVGYVSFPQFTYMGDGKYEAVMTMELGGYVGESTDYYFDVEWDNSGECTRVDIIPEYLTIDDYLEKVQFLSDGSLYFQYCFLDKTGEYRSKAVIYGPDRSEGLENCIEAENDDFHTNGGDVCSLQCVKDDTYVIYWDYNNDCAAISKFDRENLEFKSGKAIDVCSGVGPNCLGVTDDSEFVFPYEFGLLKWTKDGKAENFMDFVNSDIYSSGFSYFVSLDGLDKFYGSVYDIDDKLQLVLCSSVEPDDVEPSKVVTFGADYIQNDVLRLIKKFNLEDNGCRIVITDYSAYKSNDDYYAYQEKMKEDIEKGTMPDIMLLNDTSRFDYRKYGEDGHLADIGALIEKDPDMDIDDFCTNLFDASSRGGKLYNIIPYYTVYTAVGNKDYLDGHRNWTFDEFLEYSDEVTSNGDMMFSPYMVRSTFLSDSLYVNGNSWVNTDFGTCDFNDPSFMKLIGYAMTLHETSNYDSDVTDFYWNNNDRLYIDGYVRLDDAYIYDLHSFYFNEYFELRCRPYIVGFPSVDGCGSAMLYYTSFVMKPDSWNMDEAWSFAKMLLGEEYQNSINDGLPVLKSALLNQCKRAFDLDDPSSEYYNSDIYYYVDGEMCEMEIPTDKEIEEYVEYFLSIDKIFFNDFDIDNTVTLAVANGSMQGKTPEEIATSIQMDAQAILEDR